MILSIGMMVCDTILGPVPEDILNKDCAMINEPVLSCGGDALNTAIGLAKLSCDVAIAGKIGNDANGKYLLDVCRKNGVDIKGVVTSNEFPTACSYALVDTKGERHFLSEISMFNAFSHRDIDKSLIAMADVFYIGSLLAMKQMDEEGIEEIFKIAKQKGAITVMDAAINDFENPDLQLILPKIFNFTDIFFPSISEASYMAGSDNIEEIVKWFLQFNLKYLGIKLGSKGCFVTDFTSQKFIPCPKGLPVVDTTGAGDSFMAGLVCALVHGKDFFEAARFGTVIGSFNVGKKGATVGIPTYKEAMEFYEKWKAV
ncbi:MAG: carbohydrate kinase family protein [Lachnospiraceae bacterium]|nr:carbohydrate kinase family protein [Lachnospiraceae bacterium]